MAADTAESILGKNLAGHAIVPLTLYEAQLAVVEAARTGGDVTATLARLDDVQRPAKQPKAA